MIWMLILLGPIALWLLLLLIGTLVFDVWPRFNKEGRTKRRLEKVKRWEGAAQEARTRQHKAHKESNRADHRVWEISWEQAGGTPWAPTSKARRDRDDEFTASMERLERRLTAKQENVFKLSRDLINGRVVFHDV